MGKCYYCGKSLNFISRHTCACCGKIMCSKCIVKVHYKGHINELLNSVDEDYVEPKSKMFGSYYLCKSCSPQYEVKYNKMLEAFEYHEDVKIVSENYLGDKFNRLKRIKKLQTTFYTDKHDAQEDIKTMAKYLMCTHVLDVYYKREENEERTSKGGTHIYSTWSAIGVAAK